jgi:DNA-binding MarR family transcriptional regulator
MEINEYLVQFMQIVREIEGLELFESSAKLSKTEFRMLREIILEGEKDHSIISSELARRLGVTRSAVSQIVNKMEQNGIVKRVASPVDKKIAYIRLSEQSREVFEEQCLRANEFFARVVERYGKEQMDAFMTSCRELSKIFKQVQNVQGEHAD